MENIGSVKNAKKSILLIWKLLGRISAENVKL